MYAGPFRVQVPSHSQRAAIVDRTHVADWPNSKAKPPPSRNTLLLRRDGRVTTPSTLGVVAFDMAPARSSCKWFAQACDFAHIVREFSEASR